MNGMHLVTIGFAVAALLGLHVGEGSIFLMMASAAQTPAPRFEGYADLPCVRLWYTDVDDTYERYKGRDQAVGRF